MPTGTESTSVEVRSTAVPAAPSRPQQSPQEIAQELLERLRADARLQEEFATFHRTKHREAVAYAIKLVTNRQEAEDLVSRTYLELVRGKTTTRHFFNALRLNCLNRIESSEREGVVILRIGELRAETQDPEGGAGEMSDESFLESISSRRDNQDPLAILLAKEELETAKKIAREDPEYRWVKQKKWWRELERCNETAFSAE